MMSRAAEGADGRSHGTKSVAGVSTGLNDSGKERGAAEREAAERDALGDNDENWRITVKPGSIS